MYMERQRRDCQAGKRYARYSFNGACEPNWARAAREGSREFQSALRAEWDYLTAYGAIAPGCDVYGNPRRVEVDEASC